MAHKDIYMSIYEKNINYFSIFYIILFFLYYIYSFGL